MRIFVSTLIAGVLAGVPAPSVADAPRTFTARWEAGSAKGGETLVLGFPSAPPSVEAVAAPWGMDVLVPDASIAEPLPSGTTAERADAGTRLRVEGAGVTLRAVRIAGDTVRLELFFPAAGSTGSAYAIGVGDIVAVTVYKNPDLSGEFPVAPDGTIALPLIGSVTAAGSTESGFAESVARKLAESYLVDPQVSASVKVYQSQFVYVTGAVPRSSRVAIRPGMTMRGILSEAGVALAPGITVELRRGSGETSTRDATGLDGVSPKAGDVITVQEPRYISVYGEVRRPNRILLTPGLTLLQAIAMAEGLTDWANKKEVRILRKRGGGPETDEVPVNLNKVEDREVQDPLLHADDVIIVKRRFL